MKAKLHRNHKPRVCLTCYRTIQTGRLYCKRTGECARCWLDRLCDIRHAKQVTNGYYTTTLDVVE